MKEKQKSNKKKNKKVANGEAGPREGPSRKSIRYSEPGLCSPLGPASAPQDL